MINTWDTPASPLLATIQTTTQLTKRGATWRGACPLPFHPSHHSDEATFYYYENTDRFACYACRPNHISKTGRQEYSGDYDQFTGALNGTAGELLVIAAPVDSFTLQQRLLALMVLTDSSKDPRVIACLGKLVGLLF
jgi:hypothetical protein